MKCNPGTSSMKKQVLVIFAATLLSIVTMSIASASTSKIYFGGGKSVYVGGVSYGSKGDKNYVSGFLLFLKGGRPGERPISLNGPSFDSKEEAMKHGNKMAREAARDSKKIAKEKRKLDRQAERENRDNFWQRLKKFFGKKNSDSVMAGPDGKGDVVIGGTFPTGAGDITIIFPN